MKRLETINQETRTLKVRQNAVRMTFVDKQPDPVDSEADAEQPRREAVLQEGLDYYIENGLFVFTATFLLRRGYCCDSGCRHCPYLKQ